MLHSPTRKFYIPPLDVEKLKTQNEQFNQRFDAVDKKFDAVDKKFEEVNRLIRSDW